MFALLWGLGDSSCIVAMPGGRARRRGGAVGGPPARQFAAGKRRAFTRRDPRHPTLFPCLATARAGAAARAPLAGPAPCGGRPSSFSLPPSSPHSFVTPRARPRRVRARVLVGPASRAG